MSPTEKLVWKKILPHASGTARRANNTIKLPRARNEKATFKVYLAEADTLRTVWCELEALSSDPSGMTKHSDPFFHLRFVSRYKYLVKTEIQSTLGGAISTPRTVSNP